ncbi:MAG: hypothetical protein NXI10_15845 [bacterium]|nr:hypothetical protein [bacterium]
MRFKLLYLPLFLLLACNSDKNGLSNEENSDQDTWDKNELKENFENDLSDFVNCLNNQDYACVVDYMPERVFRMASKEQMINEMEGLNRMGMQMQFDNFKISEMSEVVKHEDHYFCRIKFSTNTTFTLSGMMEIQKDVLLESFADEAIEVKENETGELSYASDEYMYAIADEKNKNVEVSSI